MIILQSVCMFKATTLHCFDDIKFLIILYIYFRYIVNIFKFLKQLTYRIFWYILMHASQWLKFILVFVRKKKVKTLNVPADRSCDIERTRQSSHSNRIILNANTFKITCSWLEFQLVDIRTGFICFKSALLFTLLRRFFIAVKVTEWTLKSS